MAGSSSREALDIIERVLAGLAAAHDAGIIHRDVKPENVLLGNGTSVKVADFGLARAAAGVSHTRTGLLIGTAAYLAPEQVASSSSDERSDVYSAGVMLFEMLAGVQPHTGESPLAVAYKHVNSVVPAPSTVVPELPAALDALVALGTSRDPELRPADARHYLKAISEVRRGMPLPAQPGRAREPSEHGSWPAVGDAGSDGAGMADGAPVTGEILPDGSAPDSHSLANGQPLTNGRTATHARPGLDSTGPVRGNAGQPESGAYRIQSGSGYAANHTLIVPAGFEQDYADGPSYSGRRRGSVQRRYQDPILQRWLFSKRILIVLAVLLIGVGVWWLASGQYFSVPPVAGLTVSSARADLSNAGLTVVTEPARHSDTVPAGQVISTDPAAGAQIRHGGTVTMIPSLGPVLITVPPVTGQPLAQADKILKDDGLIPGQPVAQTSTTIPAGIVLVHEPGRWSALAEEQAGPADGQQRSAVAEFRRPAAQRGPGRRIGGRLQHRPGHGDQQFGAYRHHRPAVPSR